MIEPHFYDKAPQADPLLDKPMKVSEWIASLPFDRFIGVPTKPKPQPKTTPKFGDKKEAA